jgi:NTP pyrophosphatase (non-canonical NTP hydrolase)
MKLNDYHDEARFFAVYPDIGFNISYPTLGLTGEAGEVANQVKKVLRDDKGYVGIERKAKIVDELGDVLWYVANLASELDVSLEEIAQLNIDKLAARRENDAIHGDKRA